MIEAGYFYLWSNRLLLFAQKKKLVSINIAVNTIHDDAFPWQMSRGCYPIHRRTEEEQHRNSCFVPWSIPQFISGARITRHFLHFFIPSRYCIRLFQKTFVASSKISLSNRSIAIDLEIFHSRLRPSSKLDLCNEVRKWLRNSICRGLDSGGHDTVLRLYQAGADIHPVYRFMGSHSRVNFSLPPVPILSLRTRLSRMRRA